MNYRKYREDLHRIPEAGNKEFKTTEYLLSVFAELPGFTVERPLKTGLIALKKGTEGKRCIAFRADIDGLPVPEQTGVDFASQHDGFMHACGHDMHMAGLLAFAEDLENKPPKDDVLLIFQPAEEGPGGAMPLIEAGVLDKYRPDEIYALHVTPDYPAGTIATRPGTLFVAFSSFEIELYGLSAHGAMPHRGNDMVIAAVNLVNQMQTIISRNIAASNCAVVTVGTVNAGQRNNIIADDAKITGTIRVKDGADMPIIKRRIRDMVEGVARSFNCEYKLDFGLEYSAVVNDADKYAAFLEKIANIPGLTVVECEHTMASEDFGFFLERVPGVMFWLGASQGKELSLHHPEFLPDVEALPFAVRVFRSLVD